MGLLVAVGAKSVSSRIVSAAEPIEEYADDGTTPLYPVACSSSGSGSSSNNAAQHHHQQQQEKGEEGMTVDEEKDGALKDTTNTINNNSMIMTTTISSDQELQAIVSVSYYDMVVDHQKRTKTNKKKEYSVAAVKVQITPSTEALSTTRRYRDSVYHIKLPNVVNSPARTSTSTSSISSDPFPRIHAVFSSDRKFLSCLVPYPNSEPFAVVVVFQLRRPRGEGDSSSQQLLLPPPPPLPSYVQQKSATVISETTTTTRAAASSAPGPAPGSANISSSTSIIPVATNPQVVRIMDGSTTVTSIEDITTTTADADDDYDDNNRLRRRRRGPSVLLVGCDDGSILAVSYRPFVVAGVFFRPSHTNGGEEEDDDDDDDEEDDSEEEEEEEEEPNNNDDYDGDENDNEYTKKTIRQLKHITEWHDPKEGSIGRLAAIRGDGSVSIFRTRMRMVVGVVAAADQQRQQSHHEDVTESSFDVSGRSTTVPSDHQHNRRPASFTLQGNTSSSSLLLTIDAEYTIEGCPFACAEWISSSYIALMLQQEQQDGGGNTHSSNSSKLQVWGVRPNGSQLMASWEMTLNRLLDNAHTTFCVDENSTGIQQQQQQLGSVQWGLANNVALHYDACSDCLAISAVLKEKSSSWRPFVCVWNWRCNVEGLVVMSANPTPSPATFSELWCCTGASSARKLSHLVAVRHPNGYRIRKESYDASVLSTPSSRIHQRAKVQRTNFLMVGATSVSYPHVSNCSAVDDFDVAWQEAKIPSDYVLSRGSPCLAVVGNRLGKSVAVASSRGLCSLSCGEKLSVQKNHSGSRHGLKSSTQLSRTLKQTRATPRWYRFGNEMEEGAFRCLAMCWWEGSSVSDDDGAVSDDILVCLVEVDDGRDKGRYLSCWAQRRLDVNHQLLHSHHGSFSRWGVRLPDTFQPVSIDLLENPKQPASYRDRKAVVLLTDHSPSMSYRIYQLAIDPAKPNTSNVPGSYPEMLPYYVFAECASSGSIGPAAEIFLASASFAFDTRLSAKDSQRARRERYFVATIGVIRDSGSGVDALAVSESGICAVGQVVDAQADRRSSEVSRYWYADFIENRSFENEIGPLDYFVWSLQLANGALICWLVPLVSTSREKDVLFQTNPPTIPVSVHPKAMVLGCVSSAGETSSWMQQPSMGPRRVMSLGPVPRSWFGCILGSGQGCRKLHRSLCEDFEDHIFRPDFLGHEMFFPSEFVLSLPSFVPALFCLISDTVKAQVRVDSLRDMSCVFQHLHKRAHCGLYRESVSMSLELLILRVVESMANSARSSDQEKLHENRALFALLVEAIRRHSTPLQFAKLFLEVGRQIEPSYCRHMFPLPGSSDDDQDVTVIDLFELSLKNGALSVAVAFLPLFEDGDRIRSSCAAVFHQCLLSINGAWDDQASIGFDVLPEERTTIGDLFRYALKVEGTGDKDSESFTDNNSTPGSSVWSDDESLGLANDLEKQNYSLICGFRLFGMRKKEERAVVNAASSFISNGFERGTTDQLSATGHSAANGINGHGENKWPRDGDEFAAKSAAGVAARFLFASAFETQAEKASSSHPKWRKMAAIAKLLVGESSTGFPLCSKTRFLVLLSETNVGMIESLMAYHHRHRRVGLVDFLVRGIVECRSEISREQASLVLDLVLILLYRHGMSEDLSIETPGLLLLALVFGHNSSRTSDILSERKGEHPVILAYLEASYEISEQERIVAN